jgi:2-polyprenyl-3-methyl-5-hydroxy-6-metoxy-1,4-benzoquinol methylase
VTSQAEDPMRSSTMRNSPMHDSEWTAREYDAMGADYKAHNEESSWNALYERPATISLIGNPDGLRVLEAGCGPGALTEWLTTHGATVTAFDVSPEMVRLARPHRGQRQRFRCRPCPTPHLRP